MKKKKFPAKKPFAERMQDIFGGREHMPPGLEGVFDLFAQDAPITDHATQRNVGQQICDNVTPIIREHALRRAIASPPHLQTALEKCAFKVPTPQMVEDFFIEFAEGMQYVLSHYHDATGRPYYPEGYIPHLSDEPINRMARSMACYFMRNPTHDGKYIDRAHPYCGKIAINIKNAMIPYLTLRVAQSTDVDGLTAHEMAFKLGVEEMYHVVQDLDPALSGLLRAETTRRMQADQIQNPNDHPYEQNARPVEALALEEWRRSNPDKTQHAAMRRT